MTFHDKSAQVLGLALTASAASEAECWLERRWSSSARVSSSLILVRSHNSHGLTPHNLTPAPNYLGFLNSDIDTTSH